MMKVTEDQNSWQLIVHDQPEPLDGAEMSATVFVPHPEYPLEAHHYIAYCDAENGCLIATAPELLRALEEVIVDLQPGPERDRARAAIAKATGKELAA